MRALFRKAVVYLITLEAKAVLRKYKPKIIAVTGSVGKTSAKDAIYTVVSESAHVRKSEKSFNSELGLPLTVLGVPNGWNNPLRWLMNVVDGLLLVIFPATYPEWLVLEVGADRPGDIKSLAKWLRVEVVVITRLPEMPVHVEFFESPQQVVEEKASLIGALKPKGTLIVFGDDERTRTLASRIPEGHDATTLTFGFSEGVDIRGEDFELLVEEGKGTWPIGIRANLNVQGTSAPIEIVGSVGAHALMPALAAAAVGVALGRDLPEIVKGLSKYEPPIGRMRLIAGIKDTLIIDDTYNASPAALVAGLDTLALVTTNGRKIAAIGDMLELGRHSVEEHRKLGSRVAKVSDILITVGFRARDIAQGALDAGMKDGDIFQYEDARAAGKELEALLKAGDCVYAKGSQSMRMEKLVEEIMRDPEEALTLLVRQDAEWRKR